MTTPLSEETVGKFFQDKDGNVWQHLTYCGSPSATMKLVTRSDGRAAGDLKRGGAVGAHILDGLGLRLLVPEDERGAGS